MTALTAEALAALDAVVAKATPGEWPKSVVFIRNLLTKSRYHDHAEAIAALRDNTIAIVALHNAYPALRATIDAERARADKLIEALRARCGAVKRPTPSMISAGVRQLDAATKYEAMGDTVEAIWLAMSRAALGDAK